MRSVAFRELNIILLFQPCLFKEFISCLSPTFGWTHVVTTTGGKTIYISGQVSVNEHGEVVGKGDLRKQTEQSYENLTHALAE